MLSPRRLYSKLSQSNDCVTMTSLFNFVPMKPQILIAGYDIFDPQLVLELVAMCEREMVARAITEPTAFISMFAPHAAPTTSSQTPSSSALSQAAVISPPQVSQTALSTAPPPASSPALPAGLVSSNEQTDASIMRTHSPGSSVNSSNYRHESSTQSTLSSGYSSDSRSLSSQTAGATSTNSSTFESSESLPGPRVSSLTGTISDPSSGQPSSNFISSIIVPNSNSTSTMQASRSFESAPCSGAQGATVAPRGICRECLQKESDCVLLPCGHLALCSSCVMLPSAALCPVCRAPVRSVVRTFLA